ncbi:MAG: transporter [Dictyoglomus sp. NZ13-RE01]|nr:MAG: transporter [Dictyoglomus sp. NZ13-RE01]
MEGIIYLLNTLINYLTNPSILFNCAWATLLGIIIGALPGLTATMGIALLTGLTFGFPSELAIVMLVCIYVSAIYGGSRSAILINIPGTPANAATTLDGYPLARSGRAGEALTTATIASAIGSFIGVLSIFIFAPLLGQIALKFGSWEFAWLAIFGITICGTLTAPKDPLKGWIAGFLGLLLAQIGMEPIGAYPRYSFGFLQLMGGIALIPVLVGVYGIPEILTSMKEYGKREIIHEIKGRSIPNISILIKNWVNIIRSGLISVLIGVIPGVGEDVAAWVSYDLAKRASKEKDKFGKGSIEGLIAAETGNNACVGGAIIPVLTLAVPGSAPAAVLLAAMWLHGLRPGPLLPIENPMFIYKTAAMMLFATILMTIFGLLLTRLFLKILTIDNAILMPIIFVLCVLGVYAINVRIFDIFVMLIFGIIGYFMRIMEYPAAPFVLGFILGPMADENIRRALIITKGDITPFFTRPICIVLIVLTLLSALVRYRPKVKEG